MITINSQLKKVDFSKAICEIIEAILPRFTENKVLVISVRMVAENYNTNHLVNKTFDIITYRPNNYTFIGTKKDDNDDFFSKEIELERFSYHDSCWKSDGVEHIINKYADKVASQCKNNNYSVYTTFGLSPIKLVNGIVEIHDYNSNLPCKFISN